MLELNSKSFEETIAGKDLVMVDFYATWCMPCKMLRPILEKVEKAMPSVKFCSLDIDRSEEIAKNYRIFSVPTMVVFREGKVVDTLVGLNSFDEVLEFVTRCGA